MQRNVTDIVEVVDSYKAGVAGGTFLSIIASKYATLTPLMQGVPILLATDTLMGMMVALIAAEFTSSKFIKKTIVKLSSYLGIAVVAHVLGTIIHVNLLDTVAYIVIVKEGLSIISNVLLIGYLKKEDIGFLTQLIEGLKKR